MTTIAANRAVMASDTQGTDNDMSYRANKLYAIKDSVIGFAGGHSDGMKFIEWFKDKRKSKPSVDDDFSALVLSKGEITAYDSGLTPIPIYEDFTAIGSGRDYAIGAMASGKTPIEAVKIACKYDVHSGLPIDSRSIK